MAHKQPDLQFGLPATSKRDINQDMDTSTFPPLLKQKQNGLKTNENKGVWPR
jgi:hypothetical protein